MPSIQPLISKELLESRYIYICDGCVIRNEEKGRGGCRREGSQRFADTATPGKIYFGPKRSASPKSAGIYIFSNEIDGEKNRKEWIRLGPGARNLFIRISLPRPIRRGGGAFLKL